MEKNKKENKKTVDKIILRLYNNPKLIFQIKLVARLYDLFILLQNFQNHLGGLFYA